MPEIQISDWSKLGSVLRTERQRRGLSQHELAARAGTSRSWLARLETGHRGAELEHILRLIAALDLTLVIRTPGQDTGHAPDPFALGEAGRRQKARTQARTQAWGRARSRTASASDDHPKQGADDD